MVSDYLRRLFLYVLACAVTSLTALGQDAQPVAEIAGKAYYQMVMNVPALPGQEASKTTVEVPVSLAEVVVAAGKDTLRTETDMLGAFRFKGLAPGRVTLSMTKDQYAPFSESFDLMPGENVVIISRQNKRELEAASVSAEAPIMTMRGDTLVYHIAAMNVPQGDYAVDLLKQMPGVEVRDRQIYVTGEAVRRTYVNGALIFGLDPMASMENLKADQVVEVEVFDEKNAQETLDGLARNKERVMNIRTKDPIFSTTDLQIRALAGADQHPKEDGTAQLRYTAGANAHFFSELKQLSVDVVTGNVGMRSSNITMSPKALSSYVDNTDLTLGYNRFWENPLFGNALQLSYSFGHQWTRSRSRQLQNYFETTGVPERILDNERSSSGRTRTHNLTMNYDYRTGKQVALNWRQAFQFSRNERMQQIREELSVAGGKPMLRDETSQADDHAWTLNESLNISLRGHDKPLPSFSLSMRLGKNNLDAWELDTLASSYSKRYLTKDGDALSQTYTATVNQLLLNRRRVEGMQARSVQVRGSYSFSYSSQQKRQEAYDLYGHLDPVVNTANTFDFTYASLLNSLNIQATFRLRDLSINTGLTTEAERVTDRERIPAFEPNDKNFFRLLPAFSANYKGISFSFSSSARVPSVEQLRRRVDDTNPLSLIAGNPDLQQTLSYMIRLGKYSSEEVNKHVFYWNVQAQFEARPIVTKTMFFSTNTVLDDYDGYTAIAGSTLLRSENADHSFYLNGTMTLSSQWGGRWKAATRVTPVISYQSVPQYSVGTLERTTDLSPSLQVQGTMYPINNMTLGFDVNTAYIHARNQSRSMDRRVFHNQLGVNAKTDFLKYAFFSGSYSWYSVCDLDLPATNSNVHRLDLTLGIALLGKNLRIGLSGIDLLHGGALYNVTTGPSSITRTWTPVYGRYFLLDISYRFNNSASK